MDTVKEFCVVCGDDREIRRELQQIEYDVRAEKITLDVPTRVCQACGTVVAETVAEETVDVAAMAFDVYRERKGLLTPDEIKNIRQRYRLSQKSLAALLGMSEATINRYEGGGLQDEAHDQVIRACDDPATMRDRLRRRGDRLSDWQRRRVEEALKGEKERSQEAAADFGKLWNMPRERTTTTGFRYFDYRRYAAVVVWLCNRLPSLTVTSLNKYLFYIDFLHYRSESVSLTGTAYRRLPYGPVPADFGGLREQMEIDQHVEIEEVAYQNGNVGEEYRLGPKADGLQISFSRRELKVLDFVVDKFRKMTPNDISVFSHQESAWLNTEDRKLISYDKAMKLSLSLPN